MRIFLSILFLWCAVSVQAANVRNYFINRYTGEVDTNALIITPISTNILANGGVIASGNPTRTPRSPWTNFLSLGFYSVSNVSLKSAYVINVADSGSQLYDYTNIIYSGFNTYAYVYGSNVPPTFNQVTNALGFLPSSITELNTASNFLQVQITAATNTGITAAIATNISAYQAQIATNRLVPTINGLATNLTIKASGGASTKAVSVLDNGNSEQLYVDGGGVYLPEIATVSGFKTLIGVDSDNKIVLIDNIFTNIVPAVSVMATNAINATNIYGAGLTQMTNAALLVSKNATNKLDTDLRALVTATTNGLNTRLLNTNSALVAQIIATNVALEAKIVATNAALDAKITATNTAMVTRLIATNTALEAKLIATNALLVSQITAATNPYTVRAIAAGANITTTTNTSTGLITITGSAGGGSGSGIETNGGTGINNTFTNTTLIFDRATFGTNNVAIASLSVGGFVAGGASNSTTAAYATTIGGFANGIDFAAPFSAIIGGLRNFIGVGYGHFIGGGHSNVITSGNYNTIHGGFSNLVYATSYATAAGYRATASNDSTFVWSDLGNPGFSSATNNTFIIRATNGVGLNTNNPGGFSLRVRGTSDLPGITSLAITNTANVATNLSIGGGLVFQYATNNIAVTNAGSTSANGTYQYISGAVFTNHSTACVITNNGSTWQIRSGTTVLYSSATLENSAWTIQSGSSPAARSYYGSVQNIDGMVIRGYISSTNLDTRLNNLAGNIPGVLTNNTTGNAATSTTATNVESETVLSLTKRTGGAGSSGAFGGAILTNSSYSMLIPPGAAGILNKLMIMTDVFPPNYPHTNLNNIALRIVADGVLTVDIRLSDLGGVRYQNHSNAWSITTDSRWLEANQATTGNYHEDLPAYFYQLNFPMPCTNGIYAYLTNVTYGGTWSHGYIAGAYNTFVPEALKGYRLYCWSTNRAQAASTSNFLFTATGAGQLIGIQYGAYDADGAQLIYAQGDDGIAFWLNGNQKWQSSGLDDLLGSTWGGVLGRNLGYERGQTSYNLTSGPSWCESYRWLNERSAINFTNGFTVYEESNEALDAASYTFWYLKR